MKVIPETVLAHSIWYLRFFLFAKGELSMHILSIKKYHYHIYYSFTFDYIYW